MSVSLVENSYSEFLGKSVEDMHDLQIAAFATQPKIPQFSKQGAVVAIFLDNANSIVGIKNIGDVLPHEIEALELARLAKKNKVSDIALVQMMSHRGKSLRKPKWYNNASTYTPVDRALYDRKAKKSYGMLSVALKGKSITLRDIVVGSEGHYFSYSQNISPTFFPGFENELEQVKLEKVNLKKNMQKVLETICNASSSNDFHNVSAIFLGKNKNIKNVYHVPARHNIHMPSVFDGQKCIFDSVFEKARKQKAASVVLVHSKKENSDMQMNKNDLLTLQEARVKADEYGLNLTDCILVGAKAREWPHKRDHIVVPVKN